MDERLEMAGIGLATAAAVAVRRLAQGPRQPSWSFQTEVYGALGYELLVAESTLSTYASPLFESDLRASSPLLRGWPVISAGVELF